MSNSANLAVNICVILLLCLTKSSNSNESCEFPEGMCLCYNELEKSLFASDANRINLTTTFFPLEDNPPEFVIVEYYFKNSSKTRLWFWSAFTSHFLYPFEVFQFSSLFFGKPEPYYRSQRRLNITLENECENLPSTDIKLHLLTQRLKYYAERGSSTLILRDTYSAKAYNKDTLKTLLESNSHRTIWITIFTFVFVIGLSFAIVVCILCSILCTKSLKDSKLLKKMKDNTSVVLSLAVLSLIANIYIIFLAGTAVGYWQHQGEEVLKNLFQDSTDKIEKSNSFPLGFALAIDVVCLIIGGIIVVRSIYVYIDNAESDYIMPILSLTVFCPIFCIIAHSPYIAIAYLDDGSHASSIFIYYSILAYVMFGLLWLFFHWCEKFEDEIFKLRTITLVILICVIILFLGLVVTITCYFVLIPINKSISDAPSRVISIYQSGGFVIGSFLVYKIIKYFYRKKKDEISLKHIHEILQKRLPDPFQQQFHQLQQQYNRFQLELQLTPQRYQVPVQDLQRKLYEQRLRNLDLEQDLLQQRGPCAGTGSMVTAKPATSTVTAAKEATGTGSATEEATGTSSMATAKPATSMATAAEEATGTGSESTATAIEEATGTGLATEEATEAGSMATAKPATGTGSTDPEQQKQPQDSQADHAQKTLRDLQQLLHDIQKKFYQILLQPPPPTALSSTQTTQPPLVHGQSQPAAGAVYSQC